jgi:hypothetical protein
VKQSAKHYTLNSMYGDLVFVFLRFVAICYTSKDFEIITTVLYFTCKVWDGGN